MSIEITPELLDDLTARAKSATLGPWMTYDMEINDSNGDLRILASDPYGRPRSEPVIGDIYGPKTSNAEFIAAVSPDVVLALINEITTLSRALDEAIAQFDYSNDPAWRADFRDRMIKMAKGK